MSIVASRPEVRRPKALRVDPRNTIAGPRLAEVPDEEGLISIPAPGGPAPSPTVAKLAVGDKAWRVESWTDAQWAGLPEGDRPPDVIRAHSDNGWHRMVPAEVAGPALEAKAPDVPAGDMIEGEPTPDALAPATEAGRVAAWFDEEIRLAYPGTWDEIRPNPLLARFWIAAGFDLAEMGAIVGPIVAAGCPACELIGRIGEAIDDRVAGRARAREARASEEAEARARREAEGERAMFRRLIAEAAGRFERAMATATRLKRRELAGDEDGSWRVLAEVERQAWDSARRAERELAALLEGALPWLAPGLKARDEGGWPTPFGIVVDGVAYLLVGDAESQGEGPGLIARMPLDRIIGPG